MPKPIEVVVWKSPFHAMATVGLELEFRIRPRSSPLGNQQLIINKYDPETRSRGFTAVDAITSSETVLLQFNFLRDDRLRWFELGGVTYKIELIGLRTERFHPNGEPMTPANAADGGVSALCLNFAMSEHDPSDRLPHIKDGGAKPEQRLRVVLSRGNDRRKVLDVWRSGENFLATVPGQKGVHRSYHKGGRVHTRHRTWRGSDQASGIEHQPPPRDLVGVEQMFAFALRNEACWHREESPLKPLEVCRSYDSVLIVRSEDLPENAIVIAAVGVLDSKSSSLDRHSAAMCADGRCTEHARLIVGTPNGPSMYALIGIAREGLNQDDSTREISEERRPFGPMFLPAPEMGLSWTGATFTAWSPGRKFGPPPAWMTKPQASPHPRQKKR
jgi:hypothetical protein